MPERPATLRDVITYEAKQARVPPELALAIVGQENAPFDPRAKSPKGAMGIMQLMPEVAAKNGLIDPYEPIGNIRTGLKHFRGLLDKYKGDVRLSLAAYNAGEDIVDRMHDVPNYPETQNYVKRIMGALQPSVAPQKRAIGSGPLPSEALGIAPPQAGGAVGQPPPQPTPPEIADPTFAERHPVLAAVGSSVDPRTPTGRRNLAGAAGAALGTAAVVGTAPVSVPVLGLSAATAGVLGAVGGGMTAEAGEQIAGTKPPSSASVLGAGAEQGAYETAGQVGGAIVVGGVKRIASTVAGKQAIDAFKAAVKSRPSSEAAGEAAYSIVRAGSRKDPEGAAHLAKSAIGQRVEDTAQSGPALDWRPVKDRVRELAAKIQPEAAQEPAGAGFLKTAMGSKGAAAPREQQNYLNALKAAGIGIEDSHPVPAALQKIVDAPDEISFADAHKYKRLLDETVNWDSPAKKQVGQITKATRQTIRETMAVHEPYNEATDAYEAVAPLFYKGYVPKLQKIANEDPGALIGMIRGDRPRAARRLHEVLTTRAAEGGDAAGGDAAFNAVRQAWTREKLIKGEGGLPALETRMEQLDPDFVSAFYGSDQAGQQQLQGLKQIVTAYKASPLVQPGHDQVLPDIMRAGALGPQSIWGAMSIVRLLKGPSSGDLIAWAAQNSANTQAFVRGITGPNIPLTLANLARVIPPAILGGKGLLEAGAPPPDVPQRAQGPGPTVGTAPPRP